MKKVIYPLYSFLLLLALLPLQAQVVKYDETIIEMKNATAKQRFYRFSQVQKQDNLFANAYIQLADACEKISGELDPLRQYPRVDYWLNNAQIYYQVFPIYLGNNEVRRTEEYYTNFNIRPTEKKLSNEDVIAYVNLHQKLCVNYKDTLKLVFNTLEKSKEHYNNAVALFNDINEQYANQNEALLKTTPELLARLTQLETEFNASIEAFGQYRKLIALYPVGKYSQNCQLRPIETFRLDGITNSDFLENKFMLWDYGKWVAEFKQTYNTDIVALRAEIETLQNVFDANKQQLIKMDTISEADKFKSADELFQFRLGKYDQNSLVRDLFRYYNARQDLMVMSKSNMNQPTDSASEMINRKLRYYHKLIMQRRMAQNRLDIYNNAINPDRISRFSDFFAHYYKDEQGLKQLYVNESLFLTQTIDQSLYNLKSYLDNEKLKRQTTEIAYSAKAVTIPLSPGANKASTLFTHGVAMQQGKPQYVGGQMVSGKKTTAFIARVKDSKKAAWVKEITIRSSAEPLTDNSAKAITATDDGCLTVVSGNNGTQFYNTLVKLDTLGREVMKKVIEIPHTPEFVSYDAINKTGMLAFNSLAGDSASVSSTITICQTDSAGNVRWQTPLTIRGKLVDIIPAESYSVAYINYQFFNINGQQSVANTSGVLAVAISETGRIITAIPIVAGEPFYIDKVFAISNSEISLIGYKGTPGDNKGGLCYLVVSPDGKMMYNNINAQ